MPAPSASSVAAAVAVSSPPAPATPEAPWAALIPEDQWAVFCEAIEAARRVHAPVLLGGAMALAAQTGRWRNTKDLDFILRKDDAPRLIAALSVAGFADYFEQQPYDRSWIWRGFKNGVILDLIWGLPNHRFDVEGWWFRDAKPVQLRGEVYLSLSPEEVIRMKLYVMQRERCDWVDVLNVLAAAATQIDWPRLIERMGPDLPLLQGVLAVFNWMCPGRAQAMPAELRTRLGLPEIPSDDYAAMERRRVALLDSRPWFAPHQPLDRPLER